MRLSDIKAGMFLLHTNKVDQFYIEYVGSDYFIHRRVLGDGTLYSAGLAYDKSGEIPWALKEIKPKNKRWINIYTANTLGYLTKAEADKRCGSDRTACIEVEWTEGEGL